MAPRPPLPKKKYLNAYYDRHGKVRLVAKRYGFSISINEEFGTPEFDQIFSMALQKIEELKSQKSRSYETGTVSQIVEEYLKSSDYSLLASSTKKTYRTQLDKLREQHGHRLLNDLKNYQIRKIMDSFSDNPNQANTFLRYIKMVCRFAASRGLIEHDPTTNIRRLKTKSKGHLDWPDELIEQFRSFWPIGSKQRLAFELALNTGQRRSDLATMHRNHIKNDFIEVTQQKTGTELAIPITPKLQEAIDAYPHKSLFLIETTYERAYSVKGFGGAFGDWRKKAGIPTGYSVHGLRKSCCRILAEAGCSSSEIMAITGHQSLKEVERYTKAASQKLLAKKALERTY